jgi:large subunit ribosomal protein L22
MEHSMNNARARAKYVRVSPYKLRPIADVIRGQPVEKALAWLKVSMHKRVQPIFKALVSACANMRTKYEVDQGPVIRYMKPGAMGRATILRKRLSHIEVIVGKKS